MAHFGGESVYASPRLAIKRKMKEIR